MRLDGIHHISAITGDAPGNVDFYTRVLGLRLVAKTVNQDDPRHLPPVLRGRERLARRDLTFFEYRGVPRRAGRGGMVHRIVLAGRRGRSARLLGRSGWATRAWRRPRRRRRCASPTARAWATSWW